MKPIKFSVSWPQQKPRLRFEICRALNSNQDLSYSGGASTGQIFFLKIGEALKNFQLDLNPPTHPRYFKRIKKCPAFKKNWKLLALDPFPLFLWLPFLLHTQIKYRLKFSKQKKIDRRTAIENEICLTKPEPCWPGWLGCGFGFYWDIWMRQRGASLRWRWCGCWQWGRGKSRYNKQFRSQHCTRIPTKHLDK